MKEILMTLEFDKVKSMLAQRTTSVMGREIADQLRPTSKMSEVQHLLKETYEARSAIVTKPSIPLGGIQDIRPLIKRAQLGAILEPHELISIGNTLYAARRIKNYFSDLPALTILFSLAEKITVLPKIENLINITISDQGSVLDEASPELHSIRKQIRILQQRIKDKLDSILRSSQYQKYFQDVLITIRGDRYVIPIKQEYRQNFPGIVHDQSASGATVFIEPMPVVTMNNEIKQLMSAEANEIERILRVISQQIEANADVIIDNCLAMARIDFAIAKGKLGLDMQAEMPLLNDNGELYLYKARHPLIEAATVVPIDVQLGTTFNTLLITGPNTGGKTVTLKTVGLLSLMTQSGLFIPAGSGSKIPIYRNIYADIGDEQSIEQSLSTFSGHMTHLVHILAKAQPGDLILIDEIGAGTDPSEGAALAMSILDFLHNLKVFTIVTTHYSELKTFAYSRNGIENASVEFDLESLRPTYRLLIGIPGSSNAFAISQRLGLAVDIINRAKQFVNEDHAKFEEILAGLETEKHFYRLKNSEIAHMAATYQRQLDELTKQKEVFDEQQKKIMAKAKSEAAEILRSVRRQSEEIIEQLKKQFDSNGNNDRYETINGIRRLIKTEMEKVVNIEEQQIGVKIDDGYSLQPGDDVFVTSLSQQGIVLAVTQHEVTVQLGMMKVNVPIDKCRIIKSKTKQQHKYTKEEYTNAIKMTTVSKQIDIRGMTVEEAELALDKFIDDACLAGLSEVLVIHGKGTGALRKGVRTFLKNHHAVKQTLIAEISEGGDGATVVKL